MSRRHRAEKREIAPDPIYGSTVLAKFINKVMERAKNLLLAALFTMRSTNLPRKLNQKILWKPLSKL